LNRATRITQSGAGVESKRVDMTYNRVNQMTALTRFSDLGGQSLVAATSYTYDQNQRLVQLVHKKGLTNLASYNYTFDAANKLTKIVSSVDETVDYGYDATNQLTGADYSAQADESYQYDANGNRTNAGYQTGNNNQLLADGQYTYEYDGEGNRAKRTEIATGKVTEYIWDYHNRLTGVLFKNPVGMIEKNVEYVYDTNNLRVGKKIDGVVTERFLIEHDQIALVFDGQGVQKSRYLYGTQKIDQVLAEESGAQTHWFLTDYQGTVRDIVDNTGIIIDHVTYDSFGRIVGQTSPMTLRFAYTGREWDGETAQYYYRARYYDDAVGRFISEDPIGFSAGDNNLNRYVGNSPTNWEDPSGLFPRIPSTYNTDLLDTIAAPPISIDSYRKFHCRKHYLGGGLSSEDARGFAKKINTEYKGWLKELPPCPVKKEQCKLPQFEEDGLNLSRGFLLQVFHPGAYSSYRSKPQKFLVNGKLISTTSQQCTYDNNGNLITKGPGAGTPDFASAKVDSEKHVNYDVKTWCALGWQEYNKTWIPDDGSRGTE
jgi:RHS repeat-associated protein